jgi:hypothetical protein
MIKNDEAQLSLPFRVRAQEDVHWINGQEVPSRRRFVLFGDRILKTAMVPDYEKGLPYSHTNIDVEDIENLSDPDLRYALRFQNAAQAIGSITTAKYSSEWSHVSVVATNEGVNSRLLYSEYTGIVDENKDTFMTNLRRHQPIPEVPGMIGLHVAGEDGTPGTVFWVRRASDTNADL